MARPIDYERLIIGYHGCDRELGERVLLNGEGLRTSNNRYDWLGQGIYFWEHGPARAYEWAQEMHARSKIGTPYVLGAFIHLGRCFDLTDTSATHLLGGWYDELLHAFQQADQPMPENQSSPAGEHDLLLRNLDCAVLNLGLATLDRDKRGHAYQTVRGVFPEGAPAFPGARIMRKTHVQVAVRDPDCIVGYFRPAQ
mgnify:CR=1 FL=1